MDFQVGHNPCKGFIVNYPSLCMVVYRAPVHRERALAIKILHSNDVSTVKKKKVSGYWGHAATNQLFHRLMLHVLGSMYVTNLHVVLELNFIQ